MKVAISQPRYLPWAGTFDRIDMCDIFVCLDTVQYSDRDWENRNRIRTKEGWSYLTVPVKKTWKMIFSDVTVSNDVNWQQKHWELIRHSYGKCPYFDEVSSWLESFYRKTTWGTLKDLNNQLTQAHCDYLNLKQCQFVNASDLGVKGTGSDLIVNVCKELNATEYVAGVEGKNYLKPESFSNAGIALLFHEYNTPTYQQAHGEFIGNLAVIDMLYNCGAEESRKMIQKGRKTDG